MSAPHRAFGLQQRVLPAYRKPFFDLLASALPGPLGVFAGHPNCNEGIVEPDGLERAKWTVAHNLPFGHGPFYFHWQAGWKKWIEGVNPTALILEANPRYLSNYPLAGWMTQRTRPILGWSLGAVRGRGLPSGLMRRYYSGFSAFLCYSTSGKQSLVDLGISSEKIFVAPNAVESDTANRLLPRQSELRTAFRNQHGIPDQQTLILFVGRLQKRKRVDDLIRACAGIDPRPALVLVGDGPDRIRLEQIAGEQFPATRFLGDLRGEDLGCAFLAADLFVMPGTGGLALQEALAYGKPVIAAEADGSQRDLIREGENGWLLNKGDPALLVRRLRDALANTERLPEMGKRSLTIVKQTATLEKMVSGFLDALRHVGAV